MTDSITYTTFLISHIRLTHPGTSGRALLPFPISPRNSAAAVAHLVRVTGVKYLWATEGPMKAMADEARDQGGLEDTTILPFPSFSELYLCAPSSFPSTLYTDDTAHDAVLLDQPALILHSSGEFNPPPPQPLSN